MKHFRLIITAGILCIAFNNEMQAQEVQVHEPINVDVPYKEGGEKGSGAADRSIEGKDKSPAKENPSTTVNVGQGKVTVSQKAVNQVVALLQEYYGVDFFSTLFSPSMWLGSGGQAILIDRLKELAGEAALDNRKADSDFFNNLGTQIINKSNIQYKFENPVNDKSFSVKLNEPLILHNINIRTTFGDYPGMQITIPGYMTNAEGKQAELLVRFYTPNGTTLLANDFESYFRDVK